MVTFKRWGLPLEQLSPEQMSDIQKRTCVFIGGEYTDFLSVGEGECLIVATSPMNRNFFILTPMHPSDMYDA